MPPQTFPRVPAAPIAPPPTTAMPQVGAAGAGPAPEGLTMEQMGGGMQPPTMVEANAGILDQIRQITVGAGEAQAMLEAIAAQFPGAAPAIRQALEALDMVSKSLVDVLQAVMSQAEEQGPISPRILG